MFKPNNPIQILWWIFFAAKMIFEIYYAYNIMILNEPSHEKNNNMHVRKRRRRSVSR